MGAVVGPEVETGLSGASGVWVHRLGLFKVWVLS